MLKHVVYPSRTELGREHIRKCVDEVLADGGTVCYVDFVMEFVPQEWEGHLEQPSKFMLVQPEHFKEAAQIVYTMCRSGVDLVVLDEPRTCVPGDGTVENLEGRWGRSRTEWDLFLQKLRSQMEGTTVLAVNSFRVKEDPMSAYQGFPPWSRLADQESVLDTEAT